MAFVLSVNVDTNIEIQNFKKKDLQVFYSSIFFIADKEYLYRSG